MNKPLCFLRLACVLCLFFIFSSLQAQDRIYALSGKIIHGKVAEVGPRQIKYTASDNPHGPIYIMNESEIDSIVYENGKVDIMTGFLNRRDLTVNIPQLNTWTFDLMGFAFLSVSQSYERRLKNGKVGFRIPLYIGFRGGAIAGVGSFKPGIGVFYPDAYYPNVNREGSCLSTGLNVKCYLFKRRVIRLFAGPEVTMGYTSVGANQNYYSNNTGTYNYDNTLTTYGTFAMLGKFGMCLNPKDRFNITFDGGAGLGDIFGHAKSNPSLIGFTGLWHVGFAMGTNF